MFDKLILCWVVSGSLLYITQQSSFSAIIYKAGVVYDSLGIYWLVRNIIHDWDDIVLTVKFFAFLAIITAPIIALEKFQEKSILSIFGPTLGMFHRGRFRAAGPFPHYIMMGCFWATLLPLFYAQAKIEKEKLLYTLAIFATLSNVYFSASSTPIMTLVAIIIFWNIYSYRKNGQEIFWTTCLGLFILHLLMNAPVWHLMARANIFGGSTGWHRYNLFNNFVTHPSEWFLVGTKSTSHWGHGMQDITNQFVLEGVRGGLITLAIFVVIIFFAVKIPGKISLSCESPKVKWLCWGICVAMLGHFVTFWGVSYFGQIELVLFYFLALVGFALEKNTEQSVPLNSPRKKAAKQTTRSRHRQLPPKTSS